MHLHPLGKTSWPRLLNFILQHPSFLPFFLDGATPTSVNQITHQVQEDGEAFTLWKIQTCDNPHGHVEKVYVWHKSTDESAGSHQSSSQHHHYSRSVINDEGTRQRT